MLSVMRAQTKEYATVRK